MSEEKSQEQLEQESFLFRTMLELAPDAIYFKDRDGKFLAISDWGAKFFGEKSGKDMIGKSDFDYFPQEMAQEYFNDEQALMKSGTPLIDKRENENSHDDREVCFSTTKLPLRDEDGNVVGSFGISRDVTLHQKAEDDLRESEALYH
ncbi:MAG: PAS domain-containing protein [Limisphaerales bacterium]